ncbi:MAG: phosphoribosylaminoimidazolesuccinocarboxamide synthase, partial [Actinobacteria bacterium]|nr:phosphoribosylaminoimidazolesuccinocarboxamide synthase [Actinomycetota bacterium]
DSSRFWQPDSQYSYDKQFVRDWLLNSGWDRNSTPPELPADVIAKTQDRYNSAYELLTGHPLAQRGK